MSNFYGIAGGNGMLGTLTMDEALQEYEAYSGEFGPGTDYFIVYANSGGQEKTMPVETEGASDPEEIKRAIRPCWEEALADDTYGDIVGILCVTDTEALAVDDVE